MIDKPNQRPPTAILGYRNPKPYDPGRAVGPKVAVYLFPAPFRASCRPLPLGCLSTSFLLRAPWRVFCFELLGPLICVVTNGVENVENGCNIRGCSYVRVGCAMFGKLGLQTTTPFIDDRPLDTLPACTYLGFPAYSGLSNEMVIEECLETTCCNANGVLNRYKAKVHSAGATVDVVVLCAAMVEIGTMLREWEDRNHLSLLAQILGHGSLVIADCTNTEEPNELYLGLTTNEMLCVKKKLQTPTLLPCVTLQ